MPRHTNQTSFKKGHQTWIEGKHHSESTKRKLKLNAMEPERIAQSIANLPPTGKGSENPNWRGGLKTKTCLYCGAAFQVIPAIFDKAKYCSKSCKDKAVGENGKGRNNHNWRGGHYRPCEYCGHEFWVIPATEKTHRFCSLSCKAKVEGIFRNLNTDPEFQQKRLAMRKPNPQERRLEAILDKWFPGEWKFVGDGEVILGSLNPDFINCNGRKQIIEFFGCWYHGCPIHRPENKVKWQDTEIGKRTIYARYGFETLVIWEHGLDEKVILDRVNQFMARTLTKGA